MSDRIDRSTIIVYSMEEAQRALDFYSPHLPEDWHAGGLLFLTDMKSILHTSAEAMKLFSLDDEHRDDRRHDKGTYQQILTTIGPIAASFYQEEHTLRMTRKMADKILISRYLSEHLGELQRREHHLLGDIARLQTDLGVYRSFEQIHEDYMKLEQDARSPDREIVRRTSCVGGRWNELPEYLRQSMKELKELRERLGALSWRMKMNRWVLSNLGNQIGHFKRPETHLLENTFLSDYDESEWRQEWSFNSFMTKILVAKSSERVKDTRKTTR